MDVELSPVTVTQPIMMAPSNAIRSDEVNMTIGKSPKMEEDRIHGSTHTASANGGSGSSDGSAPGWFAFLKRNTPNIISLVSIILNLIIFTALIPDMKNDIVYMEGRTYEMSAQVNAMQQSLLLMQQSLLVINDKINGADNSINVFNAQLGHISDTINATQTSLTQFRDDTIESLVLLRSESNSLLNEFNQSSANFQRTVIDSISLAEAQTSNLTRQVHVADATIQASLTALLSNRSALEQQAAEYRQAESLALEQLLQTNMSIIIDVQRAGQTVLQSVDKFEQETIPRITNDLIGLNQTNAIDQLTSRLSTVNTSITTLTRLTSRTPKLVRYSFTTIGSTTWTVPAGVSGGLVTLAGGGGSGVGWRVINRLQFGHSGGYLINQPIDLVPGQVVSITVGEGGTAYAPILRSGTPAYYESGSDDGLSGYAGTSTIVSTTSPVTQSTTRIQCAGGSGGYVTIASLTGGKVAGNVDGAMTGAAAVSSTNRQAIGPFAGGSNSPGSCGINGVAAGGTGVTGLFITDPVSSWNNGGLTPLPSGAGSGGAVYRSGCYVTSAGAVGTCVTPYSGRDGGVFIDAITYV